ncbi:MAG TPA: hypothetical protein PK033_13175 [Acetivibrio sp.]|nr:hypothetical protein [Clostridium sp.]HQA58813.1 hypothetical protein [Acetivibrio sp.]
MAVVSILAVLVFSTLVCFAEIPKMLKQKLYRELWVFCLLLGIGTILTILKSLDVKIPNPSDFIAWIFSPLEGIMKSLTK